VLAVGLFFSKTAMRYLTDTLGASLRGRARLLFNLRGFGFDELFFT
jgi:hypothetical protein